MQTSYGRPLAIPLFILLAQNRHMLIRSVDKGVGELGPPRPGQPVAPQPAESRVRTVCDRFDQMNKIMVQVTHPSLLSWQQIALARSWLVRMRHLALASFLQLRALWQGCDRVDCHCVHCCVHAECVHYCTLCSSHLQALACRP